MVVVVLVVVEIKIEAVKTTRVRLVVGRPLRSDAPSSLLRLLLRPFLQGEDGPLTRGRGRRVGRAEVGVRLRLDHQPRRGIGLSQKEMGKNESRGRRYI